MKVDKHATVQHLSPTTGQNAPDTHMMTGERDVRSTSKAQLTTSGQWTDLLEVEAAVVQGLVIVLVEHAGPDLVHAFPLFLPKQ